MGDVGAAAVKTDTPDVLVVEFQVLMGISGTPAADFTRLREMADAVEDIAKDYGGTYVVKEVRWST